MFPHLDTTTVETVEVACVQMSPIFSASHEGTSAHRLELKVLERGKY